MTSEAAASRISERLVAAGDGWRALDIVCRAGPGDPAFEERHERTSVAVVLDGSFAYRSGGGRALMSPGSLLLGNRDTCFACGHDHGRGDRCVAFQFEPAFVEAAAAGLHGVRGTEFPRHRLPPHEALAPLLAGARLLVEGRSDAAEAEELSASLLTTALGRALDAAPPPVTLRDEARVAAALARIGAGDGDGLRLADLAAAAGVGRHHFLRIFRAVVGTTPHRYVLARRLAAAAAALRTDDGTVLDIALSAGFSDLSEFTRRFRARFGLPPATYRRRHRRAGRTAT